MTTIARGLGQPHRAPPPQVGAVPGRPVGREPLARARTPSDFKTGAGGRSSGRRNSSSDASSASRRTWRSAATGSSSSELQPAPSAARLRKLISECFRRLSRIRIPQIRTARPCSKAPRISGNVNSYWTEPREYAPPQALSRRILNLSTAHGGLGPPKEQPGRMVESEHG